MTKKRIPFLPALLGLAATACAMFLALVVFDLSPRLPLLLGSVISAAIALTHGYHVKEIASGMWQGIRRSLGAIVILLLIGVLMGVWITAGVVPAMVYYGLQLISPRLFLSSAMLVCAIISMALGSWGTAGTVGLAFMGMAQTMGIPPAMTAGAVISGSYVGDKLSPMADSTNLASAVAEINIFDNIRNIFKVAAPMLLLCLGLYAVVGWKYGGNVTAEAMTNVTTVQQTLTAEFTLNIWSFLPLLLLLVCILCKLPAIPAIAIGAVSGGIYGIVAQGADLGSVLHSALMGYAGHSGVTLVDELLSAGGIAAMLYSVSIVILAMAYGGVMESTGQMEVLVAPLMKKIHSWVGLMTATLATCVGVNIILPDQYIAIALPGRLFAAEYDKQGMSRKDLALGIGVGGALTSALVPWNTCGVFMSSVLGVSAFAYLPFTFYNYGMLLAAVVYAAIRQKKHK